VDETSAAGDDGRRVRNVPASPRSGFLGRGPGHYAGCGHFAALNQTRVMPLEESP